MSSNSATSAGKVYFIGAGPGDPELLTRKGYRLLCEADVLLHDALVSAEIVDLAPTDAVICNVGKRCGNKSITQAEIHDLLIQYARTGKTVIRLQGGDPLIFGRAREEIAALREAGVDFEIVPGVTAASAAAAAAQISLTSRGVASKLIFVTAHRSPGTGENSDERWASLPCSDATLAIYMPGRSYESIARNLAAAGWPPETPCVIVSNAGTNQQLILRMELGALAATPEVPAPALLLVGTVTEAQTLEAVTALPGATRASR